VLDATSQLLREVGLPAMTTDDIAGRSGVSKATLYKWWPTKYAIAVEAFMSEMTADAPAPDTGSAREDLRALIRGLVEFYRGPSGRIYAQLIGEGQSDPQVRQELREHLIGPRRASIRASWDRGVQRGELRADVDFTTALDLMVGAAIFRLFIGHAPLDEHAADAIVDAALRGLAPDS